MLDRLWAFQVVLMVKNLLANARDIRDMGQSLPGSGRSPGEENGNPLQHSCLENPHGQRRLAGYSLWSCKKLDMTEWLSTAQHTNEKLQLLPVTFFSWTLKNREYLFVSLLSRCPTFHQVYKEGRFMRYRAIFFVWHGGKNNSDWII